MIVEVQQGRNLTGWRVYTHAGLYVLFVPPIVAMVFLSQRSRAYYYFVLLAVAVLLQTYLKMLYRAPRPYWDNSDIKAQSCHLNFVSYGAPSGHALFAWSFSLVYWLDLNEYLRPKFIARRVVLFVVTLVFAMTLTYSRFILGVHSIDQLIYGSLWGIWFALTLHFIVREPLTKAT